MQQEVQLCLEDGSEYIVWGSEGITEVGMSAIYCFSAGRGRDTAEAVSYIWGRQFGCWEEKLLATRHTDEDRIEDPFRKQHRSSGQRGWGE